MLGCCTIPHGQALAQKSEEGPEGYPFDAKIASLVLPTQGKGTTEKSAAKRLWDIKCDVTDPKMALTRGFAIDLAGIAIATEEEEN
ncbi:hypothetical protein MKZ38_004849 [Zalerion maritima]|uniref:Uncharacterized protein n=1 Tax=Zalerion maritima TaxID=339359 RepID=A0AAD5RLW4_9PEZI|nr:hypothetical protein MKZ38_004849 [Zalerion maritima]